MWAFPKIASYYFLRALISVFSYSPWQLSGEQVKRPINSFVTLFLERYMSFFVLSKGFYVLPSFRTSFFIFCFVFGFILVSLKFLFLFFRSWKKVGILQLCKQRLEVHSWMGKALAAFPWQSPTEIPKSKRWHWCKVLFCFIAIFAYYRDKHKYARGNIDAKFFFIAMKTLH